MDVKSLINNVVNQFIVKPTGSPGYIGSRGFVFDIIGDENAMFDSDITDHYVEENYAIQDHIALRPAKFTLSGYVGELTDIFQMVFLNILTTIQSLGGIADYTPKFAAQATQVYNAIAGIASQVGTVLNQASNLYQTITGRNTLNSKQQVAYDYFVQLYMNRTLCTVETPWAVWPKMAIESIRILQRDGNKFVSEFSITFKQIRIVSTQSYTPMNLSLSNTEEAQRWMDGRAADSNVPYSFTAGAVAGQTQLDSGAPVDTDLLSSSFSLPVLASLGSS